MAESLSEIEKRARRLSAEDRARLALSLIESLEPTEDGELEKAWIAEVQRRRDELDRGDVKPVSAKEVFADVRRSLK